MCVEGDAIDIVTPLIDLQLNAVKCCCWVQRQHSKSKYEKSIFFLNESHINFYEPKSFGKNITLADSFPIFDLKKIYSQSTNELELQFRPKSVVIIRNETIPIILECLVQYIHNILSDLEKPEVELESFNYNILIHAHLAAVMRFRAIVFTKGLPIPEMIHQQFISCLNNKLTVFDTRDIPQSDNFISEILDSLVVEPRITSLNIHAPKDWEYVCHFVETNSTVTDLTVTSQLPDTFPAFAQAFGKNRYTKISTLHLRAGKITVPNIKQITLIMKTSKITNLDLSTSLNADMGLRFVTAYEHDVAYKRITTLNLNQTKNLDLAQLFRAGRNLKSLSIAHCGLQINLIFAFLALETTIKLETLDISGNRAGKLIKDTLTLPESLKTLVAMNIIFKGDNLLRLIRLMLHKPVSLDVSRAVMDRERWTWVLFSLNDVNPANLLALKWQDNPIDHQFFDFINRATGLKDLDIGGCISGEDPIFPDLCEFLSESDGIENLAIPGTDKNSLKGDMMSHIATAIQNNRSLFRIDLHNNPMNDIALDALADALLSNRRLHAIDITGGQYVTFHQISSFYAKLQKRGTPLIIKFPREDLNALRAIKKVTDDQITFLEKTSLIIERGDPLVEIPPESVAPATRKPRQRWSMRASEPPSIKRESFLSPGTGSGMTGGDGQAWTQPEEGDKWRIAQPVLPEITNKRIKRVFDEDYSFKSILSRYVE